MSHACGSWQLQKDGELGGGSWEAFPTYAQVLPKAYGEKGHLKHLIEVDTYVYVSH